MNDLLAKNDLRAALDVGVQVFWAEIRRRFGEVTQRLEQIETTLVSHGEQVTAIVKQLEGRLWTQGERDFMEKMARSFQRTMYQRFDEVARQFTRAYGRLDQIDSILTEVLRQMEECPPHPEGRSVMSDELWLDHLEKL